MHEMHEEWEVERSYQVIRSKNRPKIMWSEGLEREKWVLKDIRNGNASLYRNLINLDRSRAAEKLLKFKTRVPAVKPAIEDQKGGFQHKEARWIEVAIEETESFSIDRTSYWECDKKKLKGHDW